MPETPEKNTGEVDKGSEAPRSGKTLSDFGIKIEDKPTESVSTPSEKLSDIIDPAETKAAESLGKKNLGASEREAQKLYGGSFFKISDLPGMEESKVKSECHVSVPDMADPKFKGKKPRVVMWFHQNGGQKYDNVHSKKIYDEVERMRAAGDPVVLIMPRDNDIRGGQGGNWGAMQDPQAFSKMIEHAEKLTGRRLGADITLASSSGGYMGIAGILKTLRQQKSSNPRAAELYKGIKQIGLCDSLYGQENDFAEWYTDDPANKTMHAYGGTSSVHRHTELLRKKITELLKKNGEPVRPTLDINPERQSQIGHDVDPAHVARFIKKVPGDSEYLDKTASKEVTTAPETPPQPSDDSGIPIDLPSGRGSSGSDTPRSSTSTSAVETPPTGGGASGASGGGASAQVAPGTPAETIPSAPAETSEQKEIPEASKRFILGETSFEGAGQRLTGAEYQRINAGDSIDSLVKSLKENILNNEVKGATLVVLGGVSDLFGSESIDGIQRGLAEIYKLAKSAGMTVIAATLPPPAYSADAQEWAKKKSVPLEEYNKKLIDRWTALNEWILNGGGAEGEVRPDSIVRIDKQLEDPKIPGKLKPELFVSSITFPPTCYDEMSKLLREEMDKSAKGGSTEVSS